MNEEMRRFQKEAYALLTPEEKAKADDLQRIVMGIIIKDVLQHTSSCPVLSMRIHQQGCAVQLKWEFQAHVKEPERFHLIIDAFEIPLYPTVDNRNESIVHEGVSGDNGAPHCGEGCGDTLNRSNSALTAQAERKLSLRKRFKPCQRTLHFLEESSSFCQEAPPV